MRQGDHRTPEDSYVLDSRNPNRRFYKACHISYPGPKDIAGAKKLGDIGDYFCATNSLARLSSGRVEFDPSQTFSNRA